MVSLTPSEQKVADMRKAGLTQREIAEELGLSRRTIELHCARISRKTGVPGRRPGRSKYVYFIRSANGLIKIGHSVDYKQRFIMHNLSSPVELKLLRAFRCEKPVTLEKQLHEQFRLQRVKGEWFRETPELLERIRKL